MFDVKEKDACVCTKIILTVDVRQVTDGKWKKEWQMWSFTDKMYLDNVALDSTNRLTSACPPQKDNFDSNT